MFEFLSATFFVVCIFLVRGLYKESQVSFSHSDRANRYYFAIQELDKWCRYDLPELEIICKHLIAEGEGFSMNAGTPAGNEACTISGLREQIRRMKRV